MSVHVPCRRAVASASTVLSAVSTTCPQRALLPLSQRRSAWSLSNLFRRGRKPSANTDPLGQNLDDPEVRKRVMLEKAQQAPTLKDSIFEEEVSDATKQSGQGQARLDARTPIEAALYTTDPDPRSRIRWERKKVIQLVREQTAAKEKSAYARKMETIAKTEREMQHRSPRLPTSVKKLMFLARQIQGKPLQEAMLQMQFSKKKMASEVKFQLELARDQAIVSRGMGLGKVSADGEKAKPTLIKLKDGETHKVYDPTAMYVSEAWVNKTKPRGRKIEVKGRGRMGVITSPATTISVVLKEEKTRIRQHSDRVEKEAKRKPWVHLPDRPVTAQRPYYSW